MVTKVGPCLAQTRTGSIPPASTFEKHQHQGEATIVTTITVMNVILAILIICSVVRGTPISVNPYTLALEDSYGRERLFHGVNVVYKSMCHHYPISIYILLSLYPLQYNITNYIIAFPYFPITDHFDSRYHHTKTVLYILLK